jgi:glycosyltransferase involved in cell wall biosynthesis
MKNTTPDPVLSIGLPVYNGENYLSEALDALLAQDFTAFEVFICDNASQDRTAEICSSYASRDPRIRFHRNDRNVGATANFRLAFQLTTAPLFKWAAHDDLHKSNYLASCMDILRAHSDVVLAHSATTFIDATGQPFPFDSTTQRFLDPITNVPQTPDTPELGDHHYAARRFWHVLSRARWGSHIFGVIRRNALERTRILADFSSNDRATLAELALLGRFKSTNERLYLKRFHVGGSWALDQEELKTFLGETKNYSRRYRQLEGFFNGTRNKPVGFSTEIICKLMVLTHCVRILADIARGKDAQIVAQARQWRRQTDGAVAAKGPR